MDGSDTELFTRFSSVSGLVYNDSALDDFSFHHSA